MKTTIIKFRTTDWLKIVIWLFAATVLVGCDTGQLPANANLVATPSTKEFNVAGNGGEACQLNPEYYQDVTVQFVLTDAQGSPIGDAELVIYADWTANTFGANPAMALYDDRNSNGVGDAPEELVSGEEDSAFVTRPGKYTGEASVLVRVNLSCGFRGDIVAIAGATQVSATISVIETGGAN